MNRLAMELKAQTFRKGHLGFLQREARHSREVFFHSRQTSYANYNEKGKQVMNMNQDSHNGNHEHRRNDYERIFGKAIPDFVRKHYGREMDIVIYSFPPAPESGRDFWILATSGMSDFPQEEREKRGLSSRTEILLYVRDPKPWMYSTLIHIAEFPFEKNTWLGNLHTIFDVMPANCPEIGNMHSVIFIPPNFSPCKMFPLSVDGNPIELLLAIPITAAECKMADIEGSPALVELLLSNGLDLVVNECRPSMVP